MRLSAPAIALTLVAGLASVAGAQSEDNIPVPPPPATRPLRTSPQPKPPPPPLPEEEPEGEDYEPVEDPEAAIQVPRTSCHGKTIRRVVVVACAAAVVRLRLITTETP